MSRAFELGASQEYRQALRQRVCAVCLDGGDDGRCLALTPCVIDTHLRPIVEAVLERCDRGSAWVESRVCAICSQDACGRVGRPCRPRRDGRCAFVAYLPLVIVAIEQAGVRWLRAT